MYPPDNAWTTLPTLVSLQPTSGSTNWAAKVYVTDQQNSNNVVACLEVESEGDQVDVKLFTGQCGQKYIRGTSWVTDQSTSESWTDISVNFTQNKLQFLFFDESGEDNSIMDVSLNISSTLSVYTVPEQASVSYNCQKGCRFFSTSSQESVLVETLKESAVVSIFPLPGFRSIHFHITTSETHSAPVTKSLNQSNFFVDKWQTVDVKMQAREYQVLVDGQKLLMDSTSFSTYTLKTMDVYVDGEAYWSSKCQPKMTSASTSTTSPTARLSFQVLLLQADLMLTVVAMVGCFVILALVARQHRV